VPDNPVGLIDAPLGRSSRDRTRMAVTVQGREARTRYEVVETFRDPMAAAVVHCELETGRTHQIRVHLAAIGHPVLGDARYGGVRAEFDVPRPMLHARSVTFLHPGTDEPVTVSAPVPDDVTAVLARLDG
jgi:23S rRNA pseudouridine1911/1915/1917 synthase